jgi:hypothetical protein
MFDHTSRYYNYETATFEMADGREVAYKRRRFLPNGDGLPLLTEISIADGDRLDLITSRTLGDPGQYWRICDANNTMNPAELISEIGRTLRVPVPQAEADGSALLNPGQPSQR